MKDNVDIEVLDILSHCKNTRKCNELMRELWLEVERLRYHQKRIDEQRWESITEKNIDYTQTAQPEATRKPKKNA